jgi:predicted DNA repair protein MutK
LATILKYIRVPTILQISKQANYVVNTILGVEGRFLCTNGFISTSVALKRTTCLSCSICQRCPYECEGSAFVSSCISPAWEMVVADPISICHSCETFQYSIIGFILGKLAGINISIWHFEKPASSFNVKMRRYIFSLLSQA